MGAGSRVADRSPELRRSCRLHGAGYLAIAALWGYVLVALAPGRSTVVNVALAATLILCLGGGVGLLSGRAFGRWLALTASTMLLLVGLGIIAALVVGFAYLRGIYGPLGRGLAWGSLVIVALLVEGFVLPALFQLRFLLRPDVRQLLARR